MTDWSKWATITESLWLTPDYFYLPSALDAIVAAKFGLPYDEQRLSSRLISGRERECLTQLNFIHRTLVRGEMIVSMRFPSGEMWDIRPHFWNKDPRMIWPVLATFHLPVPAPPPSNRLPLFVLGTRLVETAAFIVISDLPLPARHDEALFFPLQEPQTNARGPGLGTETTDTDMTGSVQIKRPRNRPARQPAIRTIFSERLRDSLTRQSYADESARLLKDWDSPNPPSPRTVKRAIGGYHDQLKFADGRVTDESRDAVLAQMGPPSDNSDKSPGGR